MLNSRRFKTNITLTLRLKRCVNIFSSDIFFFINVQLHFKNYRCITVCIVHVTGYKCLMLPRYVILYTFSLREHATCIEMHTREIRWRFIFKVLSKLFGNTRSVNRMLARIIYAWRKNTITLSSCNLRTHNLHPASFLSPSCSSFSLVSCSVRFKRAQSGEFMR